MIRLTDLRLSRIRTFSNFKLTKLLKLNKYLIPKIMMEMIWISGREESVFPFLPLGVICSVCVEVCLYVFPLKSLYCLFKVTIVCLATTKGNTEAAVLKMIYTCKQLI